MKATYTTKNGRMTFDLESTTPKGIWGERAMIEEVFEESQCGKCKGTNLQFIVRKSKDADGEPLDYHELKCQDCGAKLPFGVLKKGGGNLLYPNRTDKDKNIRGTRGWVKWNFETKQEE